MDPEPVEQRATLWRSDPGARRARGIPRRTGNGGASGRPRASARAARGSQSARSGAFGACRGRSPGRRRLLDRAFRGRSRSRPRADRPRRDHHRRAGRWAGHSRRRHGRTRSGLRTSPRDIRACPRRPPSDRRRPRPGSDRHIGARRAGRPGRAGRPSRVRSVRRRARNRVLRRRTRRGLAPRRRDRPGGASRRDRARAGSRGGLRTRFPGSAGPGSRAGPAGWPIGQSIPKFRTEAPTARADRSNTTTRRPSFAS